MGGEPVPPGLLDGVPRLLSCEAWRDDGPTATDAAAKEALKKKISAVVAAAFQPHLATFAKELSEM